MDFIKKNKIIAGIVLLVLVVLGAGFVLTRSGGQKAEVTPGDQTENIKQLSPSDIGLKLSLRADKKAVVMEVTKLEGIKSLEYEVTYDAEATDTGEGETGNVPRGVVAAPIEIQPEDETIKKEVLLGTCSANVCKYDKVTSDIKFIIKVDFQNGEVGSVEDSVSIESEE